MRRIKTSLTLSLLALLIISVSVVGLISVTAQAQRAEQAPIPERIPYDQAPQDKIKTAIVKDVVIAPVNDTGTEQQAGITGQAPVPERIPYDQVPKEKINTVIIREVVQLSESGEITE